MQPLMNMITFSARSRDQIVSLHSHIADALEQSDAVQTDVLLGALADYTDTLAQQVFAARAKHT